MTWLPAIATAGSLQTMPVSAQSSGTSSLTVYVPGARPEKVRDDGPLAPSSVSEKVPRGADPVKLNA